MVAFLLRRQGHGSGSGFSGLLPYVRRFDTMIHGVSDQVHKWVGQRLDQVFIQVGFLTVHHQVHFFFQTPGQITHYPRETAENFLDRLHPCLHDGSLKIRSHYVEVGHRLVHVFVFTFGTQTLQAVPHQHQFAHHVHDVVQALGIYPNRGFSRGCGLTGRRGRRGRLGSGLALGFGFCFLWFRGRFGLAGWSRRRFGLAVGRPGTWAGALAMQFVQQVLEFVVGNQIGVAG